MGSLTFFPLRSRTSYPQGYVIHVRGGNLLERQCADTYCSIVYHCTARTTSWNYTRSPISSERKLLSRPVCVEWMLIDYSWNWPWEPFPFLSRLIFSLYFASYLIFLFSSESERRRRKNKAPASHCRLFLGAIQALRSSINDCRGVSPVRILSVICVVAHFTSDRFTALFIISLFRDDFLLKSLFPLEIEFSLVYSSLRQPKMTNLRVAH